jgi:hypothetical protein
MTFGKSDMKSLRRVWPLPVILLLLGMSCDNGTESAGNIRQYQMNTILVQDSIALHDTLNIDLGSYGDCTNRVTRMDTVFHSDTLGIAVFGTYFTGPGPQPLCPAHLIITRLSILPRQTGILRIIVLQPPGNPVFTDSVMVH